MRIAALWVLAPAALLAGLGGCGPGGTAANDQAGANGAGTAPAPSGQNLAATIDGNGDLGRFQALVENAGIADLLGGVGPYTVFAPTDAGLAGLGDERLQALSGETMRPQAAILLRAHIVPGTLTRRDLMAAIAGAGSEPVRMRTMAGNMLTFSREGDAVIVASDDGARARLTGEEEVAANGAVQPIDGMLRRAG